jgi:hypothetical protein
LFGQLFRLGKWKVCRGYAAKRSGGIEGKYA